jgi:hypothetical protein
MRFVVLPKVIKRIMSISVIISIVGMIIFHAFSETQPMISVMLAKVKGSPGKYVNFDISLNNVPETGIAAGQLCVYYDSRNLLLTPVLDGGIFAGSIIKTERKGLAFENISTDEKIKGLRILFSDSGMGIKDSGVFLSLKFKIDENCTENQIVTVDSEGEIPFYLYGGNDKSNYLELNPITNVQYESGEIIIEEGTLATGTPAITTPEQTPDSSTTVPGIATATLPTTLPTTPTMTSAITISPTATPTPTPTAISTQSNGMSISLSKISGAKGATVKLDMTLSKIPQKGVSNGQINIDYDKTKFTFKKLTAGDIVGDKNKDINSNIVTNGLTILYTDEKQTGDSHIKKDGILCSLEFEISASCASGD